MAPQCRGFTVTLRHTPQSVELLWTSDQPKAETSTWQTHNTQATDIHAFRWDLNPQPQQASGSRPHALDRAATVIGHFSNYPNQTNSKLHKVLCCIIFSSIRYKSFGRPNPRNTKLTDSLSRLTRPSLEKRNVSEWHRHGRRITTSFVETALQDTLEYVE